MTTFNEVLDRIDANLDAAVERLFNLIRIPSVSTDPAYKQDCQHAADWLVKELSELGFDASVRPTPGHPMVVAHAKAKRRDVPHVLFYGHYDVQPVDPLNLWDNPPFEPRLADGPSGKQILARGASDDKGQLMTFVEACRAFVDVKGSLPCDISILFEGEEESGSPSLPVFLEENKAELKADLMMVCDTGMPGPDTPAITTMLRGLVGQEIIIRGADRDLHSGMFGGAAVNPAHVLAKIVAGLHDDNGRVTLPGFYDGVEELPAEIKAQWASLPFSEQEFLGKVGLSVPAGEKDRSVLEQIWARPTCEVNGITSGYTGQGFKTVLPAEASAKISFRLVGRQNPEKIVAALQEYVRAQLPADCKVEFSPHGASPALQLPFNSEAIRIARVALNAEWGKEPILMAMGGSIPIVGSFKRELNMDSLMVGFGLDDDRIHSPNEKYELKSFHKGTRSWARILDGLAG